MHAQRLHTSRARFVLFALAAFDSLDADSSMININIKLTKVI